MKKAYTIILATILFIACKKTDVPIQIADNNTAVVSAKGGTSSSLTITTTPPFNASPTTAETGGSVSSSGGGSKVTERGICYKTSSNPTIADYKVASGSGAGSFTCFISGLSNSTTYYLRAYAIIGTTVAYGNQYSFTTQSLPVFGSMTDIDGNVYKTIQIGTKIWMAENLRTTHYREGTPIPNHTDNATWHTLTTGAYCDYNNDPANSTVYGRLYNWAAASDTRNIAPEGWHVATNSDWNNLINYIGGGNLAAGGKMKEAGFGHWLSPNTYASNLSALTGLPAGVRTYNGSYILMGARTDFNVYENGQYDVELESGSASVGRPTMEQFLYWARSIRCVKD